MPRKASNAAATSDGGDTAPRRSTRIASQPKTDEPVKAAPRPRATKKRSADEGGGEESAEGKTKKVKGSDGADAPVDEGEADESSEEVPVLAQIDIGDTLPSLVLKNEKGEDLQIAEITNTMGAVLFLVPKADTPGCTNQACGFRDIYPDFTQYGYTVYCLSADSPNAQSKWQTKKELPYPLISDPKRILITALGAGEGGKTKRSHFIFAQGGKLVDKKIPVTPADSPKLALEFIKGDAAPAASS